MREPVHEARPSEPRPDDHVGLGGPRGSPPHTEQHRCVRPWARPQAAQDGQKGNSFQVGWVGVNGGGEREAEEMSDVHDSNTKLRGKLVTKTEPF